MPGPVRSTAVPARTVLCSSLTAGARLDAPLYQHRTTPEGPGRQPALRPPLRTASYGAECFGSTPMQQFWKKNHLRAFLLSIISVFLCDVVPDLLLKAEVALFGEI